MFKPNKTIKNAKEQIQSSEILSTIFDLSPDAIALTRVSDGKFIDCNQEYLNQIGYSKRRSNWSHISNNLIYMQMKIDKNM